HYHQRVGQYLLYDTDSKTETPQNYSSYTLLDIQLNWEIKQLHFYANISNIFNVEYQDYGNVMQPGRWFSLGVKKGIGE
ncbi:MAG: hypothetical protein DRI86_14380, partial [Bacteroidetes bacterium]